MGASVPECFRLARRKAAEAAGRIGHPGTGKFHRQGFWIPATPCPRKARGRARQARRRHNVPGTTWRQHAGMTAY